MRGLSFKIVREREAVKIRIPLVILLVFLLFLNTVQAQETSYELLWSYEGNFLDISVSTDGSYLVAYDHQDTVFLFNKWGELLWKSYIADEVKGVSISPNNEYIIAVGLDKIYTLSTRNGELLGNYEYEEDFSEKNVKCFSIASDCSCIAVGAIYYIRGEGHSHKLYLFNQEGELLETYDIDKTIEEVSLSPGGSYMAILSCCDKVFLLNKRGGLHWSHAIGHSYSIAISSDGRFIAAAGTFDEKTGYWRDKIFLFNRAGEQLWSHETGISVEDVTISSDGSYVVAGTGDMIYLFNREGIQRWRYEKAKCAQHISISSDGSSCVFG